MSTTGCAKGHAAAPQEQLLQERAQVRWSEVPRQVLAFYYGWYGNPQVSGRWVHWERVDEQNKRIGSSTHYPTLGPYDTHDPKVVEQHCRWAKETGITGFIATWWAQNDFHDKGMPLLLDTAQKFGLSITAYFEVVHPGNAPTRQNALRDVLYLLEVYGRHPAWLKVNGKPVLFIYGRAVGQIGLNDWLWVVAEANRRYPGGAVFIGDQISKRAARVFDGIHTYNITGSTAGQSATEIRAWAQTTFPQQVATAGDDRIACVTIIPGYDDSKLGRPLPRPNTARHNGQTYRALWEEAIAANPDWVLITSWNEWHEGSEIEPSVENGERELKTTTEFAPKFMALKRRPPQPRSSVMSERERAALRDRLQKIAIAALPGAESEGLWFLLQLGVTPTTMTWEHVVDAQQFNPEKFPVVLHAGGEGYPAQVNAADDVPRALRRYVEQGGVLAVLPSEPVPFFYDTTRRTPDGRPRAVNHATTIGLPLSVAWEQPPSDGLSFVVADAPSLPHVPKQFAFPAGGDRRWRPLEQAAGVVSLMTLRDAAGKSLGNACALVPLGKGSIVYVWFRLLDMSEGETILYDVWQMVAQRAER